MALLLTVCGALTAHAAVAVISNRTGSDIRFNVVAPGGSGQAADATSSYTVLAGDIVVVPLKRGTSARLTTDTASYAVEADAAYFFGAMPSGKVDLGRIGIAGMPGAEPAVVHSATPLQAPTAKMSPADADAARTITVKIFVDDDEPANRSVWEHRVRERLAGCSDILERTCGVKLKVVSSGTWHINSAVNDFDSAVNDFSRSVDPGEARLAIGFTGRYQNNPSGRMHMGGTHGPLARHILVREWSRHFSETERLEFLLHEIGHFLGAVHSPETDAVMRPQLGDRQARSKRFQVHFDPLNTLAMNLVTEDLRGGKVSSVGDLSPLTLARLKAIYQEIEKALPNDPAAGHYLRIVESAEAHAIPAGGIP